MKKKYIILLVILSLTLFVGLSSNCFAFSEDDCKSLIYNTYVKAWNWNSEQAYNQINAINWTNWNNYFDNNNYQLFYTANSSTLKLFVRFNSGKPYNASGTIWGTSWKGQWINYKSSSSITTNPSIVNLSSVEWYGTNNVYYTELDVYTASNSSTKVITAGSSNRTWLFDENEFNKQEEFGFQEVETNIHVKLASDGVSMPLYYAPGSSVYFADFIDDDGTGQTIWGKNLIGDELYMYYYTVSDWTGADVLFKRDFNTISDFSSNRYINISRPNYSLTESKLSLKIPYVLSNVVYNYIINYEEDGIDKFVNYYFYIGDNNTATIDGVIDVSTSIPDLETYHNRISNISGIVNNNENTDLIVDTIESGDDKIQNIVTDDSQVDSILGNFFSGDNADELVSSLGLNSISSIQNPFTSIIYNVFMGIINCFESTENISLNFGFGGQNNIVYASQFITPANNPIIRLIRLCLIFGYVYGIVWFYYRSIENLKHLGDKGINTLVGSIREDAAFDWRLL